MLLLLLIVGVFILVATLIGCLVEGFKTKVAITGSVAGLVIGLLIVMLPAIAVPIETKNSAMALESFYYDNVLIVQEATENIRAGLDSSSGLFDAANLNHISAYAGQVQTYQENVVVYNKDLRRHLHWQKNLLLWGLYQGVSEDVVPLSSLGLR